MDTPTAEQAQVATSAEIEGQTVEPETQPAEEETQPDDADVATTEEIKQFLYDRDQRRKAEQYFVWTKGEVEQAGVGKRFHRHGERFVMLWIELQQGTN